MTKTPYFIAVLVLSIATMHRITLMYNGITTPKIIDLLIVCGSLSILCWCGIYWEDYKRWRDNKRKARQTKIRQNKYEPNKPL